MKILSIFFGLVFFGLVAAQTNQSDYQKLKQEADTLYDQKSYGLAHDLYVRAAKMSLPPEEARWIRFRAADTLWRAQSGTNTDDSTKFDQAEAQLEELIKDAEKFANKDRVFAEAHESLGAFWWERANQRNWAQGWPHYEKALDWWGASSNIDAARTRYLKLIWKMTDPLNGRELEYYWSYGNYVPITVFEDALQVANNDSDRARVHYLIAMALARQGSPEQKRRVPAEFDAALKAEKNVNWYSTALYHYAHFMVNTGHMTRLEDGQLQPRPDFAKALELFRRIVNEYKKGETQYFDNAEASIKAITSTDIGVGVGGVFLPGSEIQFQYAWRNVKQIDFAIYKIDLTRDVPEETAARQAIAWLTRISLPGRDKIQSWSKDTGDKGDHYPGRENFRLPVKLPVGAYLLVANAAGARESRDLVLVTDASLVVKTSGKQTLAYFCNAIDGSPIPNATIKIMSSGWKYDGQSKWDSWQETKETNQDGIVVIRNHDDYGQRNLFVSAAADNRQAFSVSTHYNNSQGANWRIYAMTDRAAYRPKDTVQWKVIARQYKDEIYSTPSNQIIEYEIEDPKGEKVKEGTATLNSFGSTWGSLTLGESQTLGMYKITFWDKDRDHEIGDAQFFRVEEYKLPEFKVTVQTPEENGKRKAFRLGDTVEIKIHADYYFGGPVSNADIKVVINQAPYYHSYHQPHEYPWFYQDNENYNGGYGGSLIKSQEVKTDATGTATLSFDTPVEGGQDLEFRIEARVTDSSRREIIASESVRVTRQQYYVFPAAAHNIYRPQDKATVNLKAMDANNQPMQVEGKVKITRDWWEEVWTDPSGREVTGQELTRLKSQNRLFPLNLSTNPILGPGWKLKSNQYHHDDIATLSAKTDADGNAEVNFVVEREGYYRAAWLSLDSSGIPITAETTLWVANSNSAELGYQAGNLEIIIDKDTFRAGQKAAVMLSAPVGDRYVLFSVEGEDLYSYQLVHLTGTVKLIELPLTEKDTPNLFLGAAMVSGGQMFYTEKEVIVPPIDQFLKVEVKSDHDQYRPRQIGTVSVKTTDQNGHPVPTEVALSLSDDSVSYIQTDLAGDPRKFYYGNKRAHLVQNQSTVQQKAYVRLIEGADKRLMIEGQVVNPNDRPVNGRNFNAITLEGASVQDSLLKLSNELIPGVSESITVTSAGEMLSTVIVGRQIQDLPLVNRNGIDLLQLSPGIAAGHGKFKSQNSVQVRNDFRATAFWQPDVVTGRDGLATVKVKYPDSLTTWSATARVASAANQFGYATSSTRTQQPLIVRLQAPRFFVVGDQATVSAVINNNTDKEMIVMPSVAADGLQLGQRDTPVGQMKVPAKGEVRVDWPVIVQNTGLARLKVTARGQEFGDAMENSYPIYEHGLEKLISKSGKLRGDDTTVRLDLPKERKPGTTTLSVQVAPSTAVTMLDALPYLVNYPYGCTEQTMSRFLPAAITAKTLQDLGLKPEAVIGKVFGGIEQSTADKTHTQAKGDLRQLEAVQKAGLDRLYDFQHSDGGWGWWKEGNSDRYMTAYVMWGFALARTGGIEIKDNPFDNGMNYLDTNLINSVNDYDDQAWMLHALAAGHAAMKRTEISKAQSKAFTNLWEHRDKLNAFTRSLLALSANYYGYQDKAKILIDNLVNGVKIDESPDTSIIQGALGASHEGVIGTAHWGEDGVYWRWSDGGVEATSFALRAIVAIDPKNKLVQPVVNWLVKNRRGAQWRDTRDTAITVLALNDYLRVSGEAKPNIEYEVLVNGRSVASQKLTAENAFSAPSQFTIDPQYVKDGANEIHIKRKSGDGPLYFSAQTKFFSQEEPITAAGNELFVRRDYYKLVGRQTLLKGIVYDRIPLRDGETVNSGDRVEVVIRVEAKNNYEYLLFEDLKPAGLEAVQLRSGNPLYAQELKPDAINGSNDRNLSVELTNQDGGVLGATSPYTDRSVWIYQELRDRKVAMFIDKLPQGFWEINYTLRAEVPGRFHALPITAEAMYVPEIRANGVEQRITVK